MWPRHTGDFSIFRIYADKNNQPADYSPDNVSYSPKKYLSVSLEGYNEGDFTMVLGYPGTTTQFYTSDAVKMLTERSYPQKVDLRESRLDIMGKYMKMDDRTRIQYASKYNNVSNAWKKWQGVLTGLDKVNAVDKRKEMESDFLTWANADPERNELYGNTLDELAMLYAEMSEYILVYEYANEAVLAVEVLRLALDISNFLEQNKDLSEERKFAARDEFMIKVDEFFKNYHQPVDEDIYEMILETFFRDIDVTFHPAVKKEIEKKYKGSYRKFIEKQFSKTLFNTHQEVTELLSDYPLKESSVRKKLNNDPVFKTFLSFSEVYNDEVYARYNFLDQEIERAYRLYVRGLREMNSNRKMHPDANFTMRVAYGKVSGYIPRDAVLYDYQSTLSGLMEKFATGHADYSIPEKLLDLYEEKDYGDYADQSGEMSVCFIATNHTSGGNSGSPVLNARGELIGLNFDRNWEGTMSDIHYDSSLCRNITVDIRYVLFIIDKFAGAGYLLEEIDIL